MNFSPHNYQAYAIDYIETHPIAAVLLDMGLGKTVISLTAIADLLFDSFEAHRILVVAPLRVARDTWPAEIAKWEHLQHLTYAVCVGTPKERRMALMSGADITIINRENLGWLIDSSGFDFDYDMIIIDELSSFKNHKSKRFQSLMKVRPKVKRIIGLTGTPSSNGLMDLWAEFKLLVLESVSVASSPTTVTTTLSRTSEMAKSSTPTNQCLMQRMPSTGEYRILRFP